MFTFLSGTETKKDKKKFFTVSCLFHQLSSLKS